MDLTIKYWTVLVPKTQLNTINLSLIVIEVVVNYIKQYRVNDNFGFIFVLAMLLIKGLTIALLLRKLGSGS